MKKNILLFIINLTFIFIETLWSGEPFTFKNYKEIEEEEFKFDLDRWNQMRRDIEEGREPGTIISSQTKVSEQLTSYEGGITLPYEAKLTISGRKLIGFGLTSTVYPNAEEAARRNPAPSIKMQQELRVLIKGSVGKKVNVNINFDDTQADQRDIQVNYRATSPDEFVQEAAFGDIDISIPNATFIGYRKQVFGAKLDLKYKKGLLHGLGVWSQSKGTPETRRFIGNTQRVKTAIPDIGYRRYKYYQLTTGTETIKFVNNKYIINVYVDDMNPNNDANTEVIYYTTSTKDNIQSGRFNWLHQGVDYVILPTTLSPTGLIRFDTTILQNYIIVVDYQREDGSWIGETHVDIVTGTTYYLCRVIKDEKNSKGISTELKNFYEIGKTNIIRDDNKGSFILYVQDANQKKVDFLKYDYIQEKSDIIVDWERGMFWTKQNEPFPDERVYRPTPETAGYSFYIEYIYREKTFNLGRPFIIPYSERVVVNNRVVTRDVDYTIDYDAGVLTFNEPEMILENTVIDVSYEWTIPGLQAGETFIGGSVEANPAKNLYFSLSGLGNAQPRGMNIPDVKSTPQSLSVWEFNSRASGIDMKPFPLRVSASVAYAESKRNPNTAGVAIVDSMEGVQQEDSRIMDDELFRYMSAPGREWFSPDSLTWSDDEIYVKDINEKLATNESQRQRIININYNHTVSSISSFGQIISNNGVDYSKKLYMELWLYGDNSRNKLQIDLGQFCEDVDGDYILDTEDKDRNGYLGPGEDTGWEYNDKDKNVVKVIGADNNRLDTEDLDADGILDLSDEVSGSYSMSDGAGWEEIVTDELGGQTTVYHKCIDWTGWKLFKIPLNIEPSTRSKWTYIKQLRITLSSDETSLKKTGQIKIAKLSVVGNKWENTSPENLEIYAINNKNSTKYAENSLLKLNRNKQPEEYEAYNKLYPPEQFSMMTLESRTEQALAMRYSVKSGTEAVIQTIYTKEYDFSNHKKLRFFVFGDGNGEEIFLRIGSDDRNYFEYKRTIDWKDEWKLLTIDQIDITGDEEPDYWGPLDMCFSTGFPNLTNIKLLKVGIRSNSGDKHGEIWINEIYLDQPYYRSGFAKRYNLDCEVPGWMGFGRSYEEMDKKFETFTQNITNQQRKTNSNNLRFTKINFMPMAINYSESEVITPTAIRSGDIVSVLQEGRSLSKSYGGDISFNLSKFPQLRYSKTISTTTTDNPLLRTLRTDKSETNAWTLNYSIPRVLNSLGLGIVDPLLPQNFSTQYTESLTSVNYGNIIATGAVKMTQDTSRTYSLRFTYEFWKFMNFSPSFTRNETFGYTQYVDTETEKNYPKTKNYSLNFNTTLNITRWLNPTLNYSITTGENYNYPYYDTKDINKTGNIGVSWSFSAKDIFPKLEFVKSLTLSSNYNIQGGEMWQRVEGSYDSSYLIANNSLVGMRITPSTGTLNLLTSNKSVRCSGRWNIFEGINFKGRLEPLKEIQLTGSYSESRNENNTNQIVTVSKRKYWPDVAFIINKIEKVFGVEKYFSGSQINIKKSQSTDETVDSTYNRSDDGSWSATFNFLKKYSISFRRQVSSSESRDLRYQDQKYLLTGQKGKITNQNENSSYSFSIGFDLWSRRFTPNYSFSSSKSWEGDRRLPGTKLRTDSETSSAGINFNWDTSFPQGIKIPLLGKTVPLTNRVVFSSGFTWTNIKNNIDLTRGDTNKYSITFNANYDVSQNLRASLNGSFEQQLHIRKQDNSISYNIGGNVTFVF